MNVALIGSGGRVGSRLATELLRRGHTVTGIERNPGKSKHPPAEPEALSCEPLKAA